MTMTTTSPVTSTAPTATTTTDVACKESRDGVRALSTLDWAQVFGHLPAGTRVRVKFMG
jgi:hypothetical protein